MTSSITLTSAMRNNLLSLRRLSSQMDKTQQILSTGKRVNSAIDNASNFYQARSLTNRAADLMELLNSMDTGIRAIEAANTGIESAASVLEQMGVIANETLSQAPAPLTNQAVLQDNLSALLAQGYTAITADMSTDELTALLATDNAKLVLAEDISFNQSLQITGANVTINGAGHTITYTSNNYLRAMGENCTVSNLRITTNGATPWGERMFSAEAAGFKMNDVKIERTNARSWNAIGVYLGYGGELNNVDISIQGVGNATMGVYCNSGSAVLKNISMNLSVDDNSGVGILANGSSKITVDRIGITAGGSGTIYGAFKSSASAVISGVEKTEEIKLQPSAALWEGKANTQAMVDQIGDDAILASAALQFTPTAALKNDSLLGQGNWYLPSIGELMDAYGTNTDNILDGYGSSGATGSNKTLINDALAKLKAAGVEAETLTNGYYWSSSEHSSYNSCILTMSSGNRSYYTKGSNSYSARVFLLLENCLNPSTLSDGASGAGGGGASAPQIGDVLYDDMTYSSADDYNPADGKTAVGVVTWVSEDGKSVKAMNLKDLTFSSQTDKNSFNPDDPYGGQYDTVRHTTIAKYTEDITGIDNYSRLQLAAAFNTSGFISVDDVNRAYIGVEDMAAFEQRYNAALTEYDHLINDSSYAGVNLLTGGSQEVVFNETRVNKFTVSGKDMTSGGLGLNAADWDIVTDLSASVAELQRAVGALRDFTAQLGNNYSIIKTRQEFTEALADVLETGADALTLADMNEASAEYLTLQTRQQLAVNALSLASDSARSVLRLF